MAQNFWFPKTRKKIMLKVFFYAEVSSQLGLGGPWRIFWKYFQVKSRLLLNFCTWPNDLFWNVFSDVSDQFFGILEWLLNISSSWLSMNVRFIPGIPLVKWWRLMMSLTGTRDWCIIYRPQSKSRAFVFLEEVGTE